MEIQDVGDGSVGKILAVQARGPEFRTPDLQKSLRGQQVWNPSAEEAEQDTSWSLLAVTAASFRFTERPCLRTKVDNNRGRQPPLTSDLGTGLSGYANLDTDVHKKRHTPIHLSNISQDTIAEKFSNSIKYSIIDTRKYQVGKINKTQKSHSHTSYSNLKTYSPKDIYRERT